MSPRAIHRSCPHGLKWALTLLAVAALGGYAVYFLQTGLLDYANGQLNLRCGGWEWHYPVDRWLGLAAAGWGLLWLLAADGWPRALTPRHWLAQTPLLGLPVFVIGLMLLHRALNGGEIDPFFQTALGVFAAGLAVLLLRGAPGRAPLARLGDGLARARLSRWGWGLAALGAGSALAGWLGIYHGTPMIIDSVSQIAQARVLARGGFTLDIAQGLRDVINFPSAVPMVPSYSQFPPGYIVLILPLVVLGLPVHLVNVAAAAGAVVMTALLARRVAGELAGLAAGAALALSPFFMILAGSAMNHGTTLLALTAAAWCFLPSGPDRPRRRQIALGVLGGFLLGWAAITRPLTALAHGLVWSGVWGVLLLEAARRRRLGRPASARGDRSPAQVFGRIAVAGAALALPVAFLLFYNFKTTGHPLRMAYTVNNPELHRLGFTAAGPNRYTPADALENLFTDGLNANTTWLGWIIGSWAVAGVWWLRTRLGRGERILLALVAMQTLQYGLYSYHHLVLGPRFLFELLPMGCALAGAGLAGMLRRGGARAGGLALVLLLMSAGGNAINYMDYVGRFEAGGQRHAKLDGLMRGLLPLARPTVVILPKSYIDICGEYFPALRGQPEIWFVLDENLAQARALPELAGCDWVYLEPPAGADH